MDKPLMETNFPGLELFKEGKVRDTYDLGNNQLLVVATDRISTFDCVHPTGIPDKGKILTGISKFWFKFLGSEFGSTHFISGLIPDLPGKIALRAQEKREELEGRIMLVHKAKIIPIECIVRGYLYGSGWKSYQENGTVCGIKLPEGLKEADKLPEPVFTPSTKAETGHDRNISFEEMVDVVSRGTAEKLRQRSLAIYQRAADYALEHGIIIADTKFEFGWSKRDVIMLIDEVLTPDSSRFWPADQYQPGGKQPSFDKQFVRDYVSSIGWNKEPPAPELPENIVEKTREKYLEAFKLLTGQRL